MKKKGYLVSFAILLLIGFVTFTVYNKTKAQTQHGEETKLKNQTLDKEAVEQSMKKIREKNADSFSINLKNADSFSINLKNADAKKIYDTFKGPNADEIITLLEMDHDDSDRILVSPEGTILTGKIGDENGAEVDSNTDKNSITVKELKDLVLLNKQKIDELAAQNSPIE